MYGYREQQAFFWKRFWAFGAGCLLLCLIPFSLLSSYTATPQLRLGGLHY